MLLIRFALLSFKFANRMLNHSTVFKVALFLCFLNLHSTCAHNRKFPTALTVIKNQFNKEKKVHGTHKNREPDDSGLFYPTNEWQTLKPGQAVPAGLHIRLNLKTGQREAKLQENGAKYWTYGERPEMNKQVASLTAKELKDALKTFKGGTDKMTSGQAEESRISQFYSVDELKRDMETLHFLVETDVQIMRKLLFQFNSTSSTEEQRVTALLELEYLVHQVNNAQNLVSMGGMKLVTDALNSTDVRLQESAAFVLGSAVSSNPLVQVEALESGALQKLITLLAAHHPVSVKKKALFALVCLLHHSPFAQSYFVNLGGVQVLGELFHENGAEALHVRIITILYDMITEELVLQTGMDAVPNLSKGYLQEMLAEQGWCSLVPELLASPEHDQREKALRTLLVMMSHCQNEYQQNLSLMNSLTTLQKEYKKLSLSEETLGEKAGYFGEILSLLDSLVIKTHKKIQ